MPGLVCVPQVKCILPNSGGVYLDAGVEMSRQWFGNLMNIASPRETWLVDATPYFLGTMFLRDPLGDGVYLSELLGQRDVIYTLADLGQDQPLAAGERVPVKLRITKGSWVLHMLRYLMFDIEKNSDRTFLRFMNEYSIWPIVRQFRQRRLKNWLNNITASRLDGFSISGYMAVTFRDSTSSTRSRHRVASG